MTGRRINDAGLALLRVSEGCRLHAYPDPGTGGAPFTCGWGSCGPDIGPQTVWSQDEADARLLTDLRKFEAGVEALVKVPISSNSFSSLVVFVYNVGLDAFKRSTLLRLLNKGDFEGASRQFPLWSKAGRRVLPGLVMRRRAEMALFLRPDRD